MQTRSFRGSGEPAWVIGIFECVKKDWDLIGGGGSHSAPVVTMRSIIALHTAPSIPGGSKPWVRARRASLSPARRGAFLKAFGTPPGGRLLLPFRALFRALQQPKNL
jgi:hypothetical protein